jgi:hypothetical protein
MMFAKRVFQLAGAWGIAVVGFAYIAYFVGGEEWTVYTSHPQYVHGFFLVTLAWQVAFLIIAADPIRYRLLMLAAMLEKFPFTLAILMLYAAGTVPVTVLAAGLIDGVFGILFSIAYILTERASVRERESDISEEPAE